MTFPEPPPPMPPTSAADLETAIDELWSKKDAWTLVSAADRAALLERCIASTMRVAERWAEIGARIKGLSPTDVLAGEEWLAGIVPTLRNARLLRDAMLAGGQPRPASIRARPGGGAVARVFPANLMERLMFGGFYADVWIAEGQTASQGAIYRSKRDSGRVCLVLGGGNVSSIPPMDVLTKLFAEDEVCLLKMNPVNEALGPVLGDALAPLVEGGWLRIVYGGADVGARAASHDKIGSLHVTGSDRTYDAIVWGPAEGRAERKERGERVNDKPFSAELGCVTPVIVVPGPWSASDIRFQARHVAAMVTQNASFNCNAAKVIVTARGWLQREAFLDAVHEELARVPPRKAYYPGARERYQGFVDHYPRAMVLGSVPADAAAEVVPWTAIPDVPAEAGGYALTNEAFCGVVAEVTLDVADHGGADVQRFLTEAVRFANDRCWGSLSCCMLVHPATEDAHGPAISRAIAELRYGGVAVNAWPAVIYALVSPSWGAYPGHTPEDIQSGTGVVHNAFLFDHVEKSVVRAPFRIRPTPAWFADHRNLLELGRRLADFEAKPTWGALARVALAAMKG